MPEEPGKENSPKRNKLSELPATAICGNDISSSCLYVSALSILYAGQYAWLTLLVVAFVLFLFRNIYSEVVGALPLNGGAYNALLNTTSKSIASLAACLTILSYIATAVISANEAVHYVHILWEGIPIIGATIGLLGFFMLLTILGITESSKVAIGIFITHLVSLTVLVLVCLVYFAFNGTEVLVTNFKMPVEGGIGTSLFLGFSAAMLGISGFESSANYVEEQQRGVFPKTLRNMWIVVSIFNPLTAFLALAVLPIPDVATHQEALLAHMGGIAGGNWLSWVISIDAALVLSGAVLTAYVGVSGLVQRMTLDRVMPQFLLKLNRRGAAYRIIIAFFLLSVSILFITKGELESLAGVYTISFLCVMALFVIGNVLLKVKRAKLPRPVKATGPALLLAMAGVIVALIGNVVREQHNVVVFLEYFIPTLAFIGMMLYRIMLLEGLLYLIRYISNPLRKFLKKSNRAISRMINQINAQEFVFFTKGDNVANLNKVMIYVSENEHTNKLKIVTVVNDQNKVSPRLKSDIEVLDRAYPDIDIDFIIIEAEFTPELIDKLSEKWNIPANFMFIGSPGDHFPYRIEELRGVRLII